MWRHVQMVPQDPNTGSEGGGTAGKAVSGFQNLRKARKWILSYSLQKGVQTLLTP